MDRSQVRASRDRRSSRRPRLRHRGDARGSMVASAASGGADLRAMSFDTLAPHYRWMEYILAGDKLQRCRTVFLEKIPTARNILLLGEGHGRCLVECCRRFANARITCVDASEQMLAQARRELIRLQLGASSLEFVRADALTWRPTANTYDLITTNFFLDCFRADQLKQIISRLAASATADANW